MSISPKPGSRQFKQSQLDREACVDIGVRKGKALSNVTQEYLEEDVPLLFPTTYANKDSETVHAAVGSNEVLRVARHPFD